MPPEVAEGGAVTMLMGGAGALGGGGGGEGRAGGGGLMPPDVLDDTVSRVYLTYACLRQFCPRKQHAGSLTRGSQRPGTPCLLILQDRGSVMKQISD